MHTIEHSLAVVARWALPALVVSLVGLAVPGEWNLEAVFLTHLSLLAIWSLGLGRNLVHSVSTHGLWFSHLAAPKARRATAVGLVAAVSFATMLVTLASSAALRYDPSTQFLQLLSAFDIAWVVTGLIIGLSFRVGRGKWMAAGVAMTVMCVFSIYLYVDAVGFGPNGEWLVRASEMLRLVIPFDVAAAVMTTAAILWGSSVVSYPMAQPSDQSYGA